jgi:hypothetical protein
MERRRGEEEVRGDMCIRVEDRHNDRHGDGKGCGHSAVTNRNALMTD